MRLSRRRRPVRQHRKRQQMWPIRGPVLPFAEWVLVRLSHVAGTGANNTRVTEAFDLPNLVQTPIFTVSDATGDNDGFPEPGEPLTFINSADE